MERLELLFGRGVLCEEGITSLVILQVFTAIRLFGKQWENFSAFHLSHELLFVHSKNCVNI